MEIERAAETVPAMTGEKYTETLQLPAGATGAAQVSVLEKGAGRLTEVTLNGEVPELVMVTSLAVLTVPVTCFENESAAGVSEATWASTATTEKPRARMRAEMDHQGSQDADEALCMNRKPQTGMPGVYHNRNPSIFQIRLPRYTAMPDPSARKADVSLPERTAPNSAP